MISEISWFSKNIPEQAIAHWQKAYQIMGSETENIGRVTSSGFIVLSTHRLPTSAWWLNYYEPLQERMRQIEVTPLNQSVIRETESDYISFFLWIDIFAQFSHGSMILSEN